MNNSETPTEESTTTTTTPTSKEEIVEHVEADVVCPGYSPLGTAPETLLTLIESGFNPLFLI